MSVVIYHNPRCSKSRQTLDLLREQGIEPIIIEYLKTPPSSDELERILGMLGMQPEELMRKGEREYEALVKGRKLPRAEIIRLMIANPILIERPIVVHGDKAALGRPPESVLSIL